MTRSSIPGAIGAAALVVFGLACSDDDGGGAEIKADLGDFVLEEAEKRAVETVQNSGEGAAGSYAYDETAKTLTLSFASSSFQCDGPEQGHTVTATITELTATHMAWETPGDSTAWTRVGRRDRWCGRRVEDRGSRARVLLGHQCRRWGDRGG